MKRILIIATLAMLSLASCNKDGYDYKGNNNGTSGSLSLADFALEISKDTQAVDSRASEEADGTYLIYINNKADGSRYLSTTYNDVKTAGNVLTLPAGEYTLVAQSAAEIPIAAFEKPVYGASQDFTITAGETTTIGAITCKLLSCKVSIRYNDDFLKTVTGNCTTTVELTQGYPLAYELTYANGKSTYEMRNGFFAVNSGSTLEITFKGQIDGKSQRMTKAFESVAATQWRQVTFIKKVDENGNATFDIEISDYVDDETLSNDVTGEEDILGNDPNAPTGDGGITLESTCAINIEQPIVVPALPAEGADANFTLTMKATVPDGVRKFTVDVESTNTNFPGAVAMVNNGSSTLDLVNPTAGAIEVFQTIVPFPYGDAVNGKTEILFDLSPAQTPILGFVGTHTFKMNVTDNNGHKKVIPISLVVE